MGVKYAEVMERMRQGGRFKNPSAIARALGITPQALSSCKKRGELPSHLVIKFSSMFGISIDWLLTGKGEMSSAKNTQERTGKIKDLVTNAEELEYADKLIRVLRSHDARSALAIINLLDSFLDGSEKPRSANSNE